MTSSSSKNSCFLLLAFLCNTILNVFYIETQTTIPSSLTSTHLLIAGDSIWKPFCSFWLITQQTNPFGGPAISDRPATTWAAITEHRQMQRAARGGLCGLGGRRPGKRPCPSDPAPGDPRDSQTRHPTEASRPGVHHSRMRGKKDGRPRTH